MYKGKKILAIIPARSGSKGIKDKNIKLLNGKPLMYYTIDAALRSNVFQDIVVSTDSEKYAQIARSIGAKVPFIRPENLATDKARTDDVILHTIEELYKRNFTYDYIVLLQPTSPLRKKDDIINVVDTIIDEDLNSVVSVCEVEYSPYLCNKLNESLSLKDFIIKDNNKRRQDLEQVYRLNGAIYATKVENYLRTRNFYGDFSKAYIMDKLTSVDIDDDFDFNFAEYILKNIY